MIRKFIDGQVEELNDNILNFDIQKNTIIHFHVF